MELRNQNVRDIVVACLPPWMPKPNWVVTRKSFLSDVVTIQTWWGPFCWPTTVSATRLKGGGAPLGSMLMESLLESILEAAADPNVIANVLTEPTRAALAVCSFCRRLHSGP